MRFHPVALAVALSGSVSAVPVDQGSHQAKALGLWQKPADNSTQHVRFAVISPGTADGAFTNSTGAAPSEEQLAAFLHHNGPVQTGINANVFGLRAKGCEAAGDCFITRAMCDDENPTSCR